MLEDYIESCDVVVHFVGRDGRLDASVKQRRRSFAAPTRACGSAGRKGHGPRGAWAPDLYPMGSVARDRLQQGRREEKPRHRRAGVWRETRRKIRANDASRASQADHLTRLKAIDFYPAKPFTSADNLVARVFGSAVLDALKKAAGSITKPRNLPFASLGGLFAGRDEDLADLHTALLGAKGAPVALYGLGGIGKTRLAIEYAWSREAVYSALLFVSASDGAALNAGLAGLTAFENSRPAGERGARRRDQDHRRPALA